MPLVKDDVEVATAAPKPPKKPKPSPAPSSAPAAPSSMTGDPRAAVAPDVNKVADDIGMLTGALTTVSGFFGDAPDTAGLTAPTQEQAAIIDSLSISAPEKEKLLSGITPEQAKAIAEQAPYVDLPGGYARRGRSSGWDAPLGQLAAENPRPVAPEISEAAEADDKRRVRAEAIGVDMSGASLDSKTPKAKALSWEAYNALSERERAAVDFNTMLTKATARDVRKSDKLADKRSADEIEAYNNRVAAIFGEDGGSEIFAPETVALLDQIQFKDDNADLDDFLGLKTVIRGKDLKTLDSAVQIDIPFTERDGFVNPEADNASRGALVASLAEKTGAMQREIAAGEDLLDSVTKMMSVDRGDQIALFGGKPKDVNAPLGYGQGRVMVETPTGPTDLEENFRLVFDTLAKSANRDKMSEILGVATTKFDEVDPKAYTKFLNYLDTRSRQSLDYQLPLSDNADAEYLTPDEFRVKLGLAPKEKADGGR